MLPLINRAKNFLIRIFSQLENYTHVTHSWIRLIRLGCYLNIHWRSRQMFKFSNLQLNVIIENFGINYKPCQFIIRQYI